jgi:hypothetical protein
MPRSVPAVRRSNRKASHMTWHRSVLHPVSFLLVGTGWTGGMP